MRWFARVLVAIACFMHVPLHALQASTPSLSWKIVESYPHDTTHFTQGLVIHNGELIESTGGYGSSGLYAKEIASGRTLRAQRLPGTWFGEGATVWRDQIIVLTWREQIAQWFDLSLKPLKQQRYVGEGWGITHDGTHLIMSDGSARLRFRSADDFKVSREVVVRDGARAVAHLNELEFARGKVFANVWQTEKIAVIDASNGAVSAWLDLSSLKMRFQKPKSWNPVEHVLNGIAFDNDSGLFYVTGKCWPLLFALKIEGFEPARTAHAK